MSTTVMKLSTIIVTRSNACHVKTLHTILRMNIRCVQNNIANQIVFVKDDPFEKAEVIHKNLKTSDRLLFIDFGKSLDDNSLDMVLKHNDTYGVIVFPGVKEGIDWDMFKKKTLEKSSEPVHQMGLHFDTEVDMKIADDVYRVINTSSGTWCLICKQIIKKIRDNRTGTTKIQPKMDVMFSRFKEYGVKIVAFTAAQVTSTYTHECFGNIVNSAGVKAT